MKSERLVTMDAPEESPHTEEIRSPDFIEVPKPASKGGPVGPVALQKLLDENNWPMEIKVKVVDFIQTNNRLGVYSYTIDFIPGKPIRIENGVVKP